VPTVVQIVCAFLVPTALQVCLYCIGADSLTGVFDADSHTSSRLHVACLSEVLHRERLVETVILPSEQKPHWDKIIICIAL
jgi:hypothetical protein